MKTNTILEVRIDNARTEVSGDLQENQDYFTEIMTLISEMNIVGFEPNLDENLNSELGELFPGKYHILAILRDLFLEFKSHGDELVTVEQGTCGHNCDRKCEIINLRGNKSQKNFAFGLDKTDEDIVNFHTCYGFVNKKNEPQFIDGDMMMNSLRKAAELKGKDTSKYDDKMKRMLMIAVEAFHK